MFALKDKILFLRYLLSETLDSMKIIFIAGTNNDSHDLLFKKTYKW